MEKELLTIPEFCTYANIGRTYTYRLMNDGKLNAIKIGNRTFITRAEMLRWIKSLTPYTSESREK